MLCLNQLRQEVDNVLVSTTGDDFWMSKDCLHSFYQVHWGLIATGYEPGEEKSVLMSLSMNTVVQQPPLQLLTA